jgi:hypothetical protein
MPRKKDHKSEKVRIFMLRARKETLKRIHCIRKLLLLNYEKFKAILLILVFDLDKKRIEIFLISLAIICYGITIYTSARVSESNFYFQASLNAYQNKALVEIVPREQAITYENVGNAWIQTSEYFRGRTRLWSYTSICCMWSLLFLLITFPFLILKKPLWIIPFCVSIVFLIINLYVHCFKIGLSGTHPILEKLAIFPFLSTYFPDWETLVEMIKNGSWI